MSTVPETRAPAAPARTEGVELLGAYEGSGFREPRFLARRGDGQVVQLPHLLYRLLTLVDGAAGPEEVATRLGVEVDREVSSEQVSVLLDRHLVPAGLVVAPPVPWTAPTEGVDPAPATGQGSRPDHLLLLRLRVALVPEVVSWRIAGVFAPLFRPVVVALALAAFVAVDVALLVGPGWGAVEDAGRTLVQAPLLTLAVLGVLVVAGLLHEAGHVGACRYGGAVPGTMGAGLYIVWPAFYSDVTDAYRLSRGGRLRTDLGGVYVNALVLAVVGALYLATGQAWLAAVLIALHVETAWQFLPSIRLDGYYILADLVGVPDLFSRLRPVLRSLVRRGEPDRRVRELKPWVRRVVTVWVVLVVPFLLYWLVLFAVLAPQLAPATWAAAGQYAGAAARHGADGSVAAAALDAARFLLLLLPWVAGGYLLARLARTAVRPLVRWVSRRSARWSSARRRTARRVVTAGAVVVAAALGLLAGLGLAPAAATGPSPVPVASSAAPFAGPPTVSGRVVGVPDPHTVVVDVAGRAVPVEVVGLDRAGTPPCATRGATAYARDMLAGRPVTLVPDPTLSAPAAGAPWRAHVVTTSQLSYTDAALRAGWARAGPGQYREVFDDEEAQARSSELGMWGRACR